MRDSWEIPRYTKLFKTAESSLIWDSKGIKIETSADLESYAGLDRTNVVQSACAQKVLEKQLHQDGYEVDLLTDATTQWFNASHSSVFVS